MGVGGQYQVPAALPSGETRYPFLSSIKRITFVMKLQ
jgi:hypothetical protein